jgi:uncharacterized protein YdcH (DUF465 family)
MDDLKIREILIEKNDEFKQLFLNHQDCEEKLWHFLQKEAKSELDEIEETTLKKKKLLLKDAMQKHIFEFKKRLE